MKIPSDIKHIKKVSREIKDFLKSKGVGKSYIFDICLSLEEAVKNAIIHGNKRRRELSVYITYSFKNGRFSVEVEDQGSGFDFRDLPDPTEEENLYKYGGRGIFLIRRLMDEARYSDKGNKIFMIKHIKC